MEYSEVIKMILNDFNRSFDTSAQIVYDTRENVMRKNPEFRVGNTAGGFYDTKSKVIYLFSEVVEKIRNQNYDNEFSNNDNGLTYLIFSSFHELEHFIQKECPEKLKNQFAFSKMMYAMEQVIINTSHFDPSVMSFDYHKKHDSFLLEIDADKKGSNNARSFVGHHNIPGVNQRYLDLMDMYNNFRINNYDIPLIVNQFAKIIRKYPDMLKSKEWIDCDELIQFFNQDGTLKSINELMGIQSALTPYIVSSINCVSALNDTRISDRQNEFVQGCLKVVIDEHDDKQRKLSGIPNIEFVVEELKKYTQVNGNNSKSVERMANENYYSYLRQVQTVLQSIEKKPSDLGGYSR